eukprot:PLAT1255.1.p2 GENE.PLAT1255.1~~PLAT1255.1.p2  ORF type:complete len:174 (-),score=63.95 PLAT1255.1:179-700(-)
MDGHDHDHGSEAHDHGSESESMDMDDHDHSMDMSGHNHGGMTFVWSTQAQVLFSFWSVSTGGGYFLSLVVIFGMTLLYEWLTSLDARRFTKSPAIGDPESGSKPDAEESEMLTMTDRLVNAILYGLQNVLSLFIMLIAMTFNAGYFMTIIIGVTAGHMLFHKRRNQTPPAVCH